MAIWLAAAGVAYRHFVDLGGRRPASRASVNTGLRNASFRGYADYMATTVFQRTLDALVQWSGEQPTAIMCAEAVYWRCHRSLISDALVARGVEVRHIVDGTEPRTHKLHEQARVHDAKVTYPGLL